MLLHCKWNDSEAAIADVWKSDAGSACDTDPQNQLEVALTTYLHSHLLRLSIADHGIDRSSSTPIPATVANPPSSRPKTTM